MPIFGCHSQGQDKGWKRGGLVLGQNTSTDKKDGGKGKARGGRGEGTGGGGGRERGAGGGGGGHFTR